MNMKQLFKAVKDRDCDCDSCKRNKEFFGLVAKLPEKDQRWMVDFYNHVIEIEIELEMRNAHTN